MKYFEGKDVLINIDRAWEYFEELLTFFDKYNVKKQLVIKSSPKKEFLDIFEKHNVKYMYMLIVKDKKEIETALEYNNVNIVGFEIIAKDEKDDFFDDGFIKEI